MESTFHMKCFMSPIRLQPLSKMWNPKNCMYHLEKKLSSEASKITEISTPLFECSSGCNEAFESFAQLELHLHVGKHTASRLNQYVITSDWALKFSTVDNPADSEMYSVPSGGPPMFSEVTSSKSSLQTGWA